MTAHANDLAVDVRGLRKQYGDVTAVDVRVLGTDPAMGTRAWRSCVGIVWQGESAPVELTVRETVRHFARYYPRPRDPEEVIGLVGWRRRREAGSRPCRAAGADG